MQKQILKLKGLHWDEAMYRSLDRQWNRGYTR